MKCWRAVFREKHSEDFWGPTPRRRGALGPSRPAHRVKSKSILPHGMDTMAANYLCISGNPTSQGQVALHPFGPERIAESHFPRGECVRCGSRENHSSAGVAQVFDDELVGNLGGTEELAFSDNARRGRQPVGRLLPYPPVAAITVFKHPHASHFFIRLPFHRLIDGFRQIIRRRRRQAGLLLRCVALLSHFVSRRNPHGGASSAEKETDSREGSHS